MHLSENTRVIVVRDRLFDFYGVWVGGEITLILDFFFFAHRRLAFFYFSARIMRIKTKQKKFNIFIYISVDTDLEWDTRLNKSCFVKWDTRINKSLVLIKKKQICSLILSNNS